MTEDPPDPAPDPTDAEIAEERIDHLEDVIAEYVSEIALLRGHVARLENNWRESSKKVAEQAERLTAIQAILDQAP